MLGMQFAHTDETEVGEIGPPIGIPLRELGHTL
jgi:hypothetical protein